MDDKGESELKKIQTELKHVTELYLEKEKEFSAKKLSKEKIEKSTQSLLRRKQIIEKKVTELDTLKLTKSALESEVIHIQEDLQRHQSVREQIEQEANELMELTEKKNRLKSQLREVIVEKTDLDMANDFRAFSLRSLFFSKVKRFLTVNRSENQIRGIKNRNLVKKGFTD